ncbi:hypothetical protein ABQF17_15605 [Mycolicibacterium elephantis]|uniref:Rv0361 family membrane protein n=1 Tax=Mycolicibacterium elephantis TaxID=81858 RepID=UPI0006292C36|nr:hypothetical protein [Mycolicibacterium elephantis]KKW62216.1 hypothetical protein AAV95_23530 [Mycolicibacterium elephantis]OBA72640.1 hypothetical protein A5633_22455 [Mycolicibacterium elephantis]OBE93118.1 hypothetical protein A5776_06460 [Mycolicibacterium elephantis]
MAGPYPPEYGAGPAGPQTYPQPFPQQPFPPSATAAQPYPDDVGAAYPGMLPPPVQYGKRRRWPVIVGAVLALVVIGGLVAALVLADRGGDSAPASGALTEASAKAAIQEYLDALSNGDDETVARHTLCGLFDAVKERRSDLALAGLSSDAFRKQYSQAQVASIDKMVRSSPHQAQVLFTMSVTPASTGRRGEPRPQEQQAVAQLLAYDNEVLVCSYLPRTGQY